MKRSLYLTYLPLFGTFATIAFLEGCGGSTELNFVGSNGGSNGSGDCGDGKIVSPEICDDKNTDSDDGCSESCEPEPGWVCTGEPSSCGKTCGNDKLDDGEECEDGNVAVGDGCNASCQIEGSCDAPLPLKLTAKDGVLTARVDSSTSGGGGGVAAAKCGSETPGAGPDRIFEVELEDAADLKVRLSAGFNGLIRVLDQPCSTKESRACVDEGGTGDDETLLVPNLEAGKHYIVIDGAAASAKGDFTIDVTASCPAENVRISRLDSYERDGVYLRNYGESCGINLNTIGLTLDYGGSTAVDVDLPDRIIAPGEEVAIVNNSYDLEAFDEIPHDVYWYPNPGGAAYLCRGTCSTDAPERVVDLVTFGVTPPSLPSGLTFDAAPLPPLDGAGYPDAFTDYRRVVREGSNPDFLDSDWGYLFEVNPARFPYTYGWQAFYSATYPNMSIVDDATLGKKVISISKVTAQPTEINGWDAAAPNMTPSYIRYRLMVSVLGSGAGYTYFGSAGAPESMVYQWVNGSTLYINGDSSINRTIDAGTWYTIEYRNIDWDARTFDVYFDSVLWQAGMAMDAASPGYVSNVRLMQYVTGGTSYYTDILMR